MTTTRVTAYDKDDGTHVRQHMREIPSAPVVENELPPEGYVAEEQAEEMPSTPIQISVQKSRGYSGKTSQQGWISEPLRPGESSRVFIEPDHMDWGDSELYRKHKGKWRAVYRLPPDQMYDVDYGGGDGRTGIATWRNPETGHVGYIILSDSRRAEMLHLIDDEHMSVREARLKTKPKTG